MIWRASSSRRRRRSAIGSRKPTGIKADRDDGRRQDGVTSSEREELLRLRRENRQLKLERDILSKAAAWFARETNKVPSNDGSS